MKNKKDYLEQSSSFLQNQIWGRIIHCSLCKALVLHTGTADMTYPGCKTHYGIAQMCLQSCCGNGVQEGKILSKWNEFFCCLIESKHITRLTSILISTVLVQLGWNLQMLLWFIQCTSSFFS